MFPLDVLAGLKANIWAQNSSSPVWALEIIHLKLPAYWISSNKYNLVFSNRRKEASLCVPESSPPGISFSLVICFTDAIFRTSGSPYSDLWNSSEIMWALSLLQHSLENASRQIMGLILPVSFSLELTILCCPLSYIWKHLANTFLSSLYVYRKLQSLLFILTRAVSYICSFLITFCSLLILWPTNYLLKHFISYHSTFNF